MRALFLVASLLTLAACGKDGAGSNRSTCISRESKVLQCRAEEAAKNFFNTPAQLQWQKDLCERLYMVNRCY